VSNYPHGIAIAVKAVFFPNGGPIGFKNFISAGTERSRSAIMLIFNYFRLQAVAKINPQILFSFFSSR